jgi:hypothetical protein
LAKKTIRREITKQRGTGAKVVSALGWIAIIFGGTAAGLGVVVGSAGTFAFGLVFLLPGLIMAYLGRVKREVFYEEIEEEDNK